MTSRRTEHAFVGHDRRVYPLGDVLHAVEVLRLDRLLDQLQPHAGVFQRLQRVDRLLRRPALIGVEAQQGASFNGGVDRLDAFDVDADVLADLDLQRLEAAFHRGDRVRDHLVDVVDADRDVGRDDRIAAAEHLVERRVVELAAQVVDRDLDRRLGAGVFLEGALNQLRDPIEIGDVLADEPRRNELADGFDDRAMRIAGDHRRRGRLAIADVPRVGVHRDDDVFDLVDRAQRRLEGRLQRYAQHAKADFGDFHDVLVSRSGTNSDECCGCRRSAVGLRRGAAAPAA